MIKTIVIIICSILIPCIAYIFEIPLDHVCGMLLINFLLIIMTFTIIVGS